MRTPRTARTARSARPTRPVRALAGVLLAASLALAGCSAADDSGHSSAKPAADGVAGPVRAGSGTPARKPPRLPETAIIRTASLTLQVKDVSEALDKARTTAEDAGGYVGTECTGRDGGGHEHTRVVLRVPAARYDAVLAHLQGTGRLVERTAKAQDVTDQVVDVASRVKSQRASVDRIRALMDRATKLGDVVALEGELSSRQADLEALLARQASLKDRTALATITLSLSGTPVRRASGAGDGSPGFVDALSGGWHVFVTVLRWVVLALGAVLPFAVFAALSALLWLRVVRPRLPRRPEPAPAMTALGPLPSARPAPEPEGERPGRD